MPVIRQLPRDLQPLANKFYRQCGSPMRSRQAEQIWVAQENTGIIASVCLHTLDDILWLTSLLVMPALRGKGIAGQLLANALNSQEKTVWLFCHPDLSAFYRRHGFHPGLPDNSALLARLQRYQQNKPLLAMYRPVAQV